ncbi:MAG: histidine kinase [bacterium]
MTGWIQKYRSFILRMVWFVVILTLVIFVMETIITGKFWLLDLYENFIYVACCTFFCTILLRGLYERIYGWPRFLFFTVFMLLSSVGIGIGLVFGTLILEGRLYFQINFLLSILIGLLSSIGVTFYEVQKSRLEENAARLKAAELEVEQLKRLESEARFITLQAKLHPHFLFNTLNSLAALVYEDPKKTEQSIVRLSDLYRRILSISNKTFIRVEEELELIRDYLELEKLRFEDCLTYAFECPDTLRDRKIPGLLIEPLVGNVIKHVLDRKADSVRVEIKIEESDGRLQISVFDNGPGFDPAIASQGYGLKSIEERLRLLFGEDYDFEIRSKPGEGSRVTIRIPAKINDIKI